MLFLSLEEVDNEDEEGKEEEEEEGEGDEESHDWQVVVVPLLHVPAGHVIQFDCPNSSFFKKRINARMKKRDYYEPEEMKSENDERRRRKKEETRHTW